MFLFLQSILFCLIMGCSKQQSNITLNNTATTMNSDTSVHYRWLALGDSYTIGESVNENERFPAHAIAALQNDSIQFSAPQYIATTGWTTQDLLNAIAAQNPKAPFDMVSLLIGVNDQYQHLDTAGYKTRFTTCLQQALALAGNKKDHVFVLSIPDYSVTPFARGSDTAQIRKEIDAFNAINKAITTFYQVSYIDITPLTREAKNDASLITNDGLHPSGKEYGKWAELLVPEIKKVLK